MTIYRERLWASPWLYLSTALVIPASLLVFWPINFTAGVIVAIVLYAACVTLIMLSSPSVIVTEKDLIAGGARMPRELTGKVECFREPESTLERGQRLDARAWLLIRGWIAPVVKIENLDPKDPTPYWLVSSRHPERLEAALTTTP
ncbi:MAG: DUF3093 domain-containing protein [Terrimesophilobacter sp.]